jgi:Protein of unknown function (DUF3455)
MHIKTKNVIQLLVLIALVTVGLQPGRAMALDNTNGPELPAQCGSIVVPEGNKLSFHVYARGVQVYRWNGATWEFVAPVATLFAESNYFGEVGMHYVGPHWESKSGSKVKAARVPGTGCAPDANAIPWLILKSTETSGSGIFSKTTFVQRVNTTGGNAPTAPGVLNELQEVEYTAEYYFYRAENPNGN